MTLLAPWAFWFLSVIPVIVMLYLLKLKRRPVQVSTLMFWQRVLKESRRRALFQRLRNWLSMLLHLLIFLLILLALAKPEWGRFIKSGASTVLILDARARMQAMEKDGQTRFEKAKQMLASYISRAGDQNQMTLLVSHDTPEVIVPFSGNEKAFQQAIASLQPTDAAGTLDSTVHLADELLSSRAGEKRIVIFTDQKSAISNLNSAEAVGRGQQSEIDFVPTGTPQPNVAITRFAARPLPASPQTSQILLELQNFSNVPANGNVELYLDGNLIDVKPFTLLAHGSKTSIFPSVRQPGENSRGWLIARLDTKDALASDNEAFAVLASRQPARVLLVTRGNWFLEKMLAADDLLKFDLLAPDAFESGMAKNFDAVILDDVMPAGFDLQKTEGNFLFIKKTPFAENPKPLDQPLITDVDEESPLMRLVNLKNVTFLRALEIPLQGTIGAWHFTAPLRSFDNPLVIAGSREAGGGEQRMVAFSFDIADSDLPLRVAFPLLMSNTLEWLAGERSDAASSFQAGAVMELQPKQTIWKEAQRVISPQTKIDPSQLARNSFQPLKNGFYLLQTGENMEWIAVNTFSESESDLLGTNAENTAIEAPAQNPSFALFTSRPLWNYFALAAFALFSLEWWLYHCRRTE
jgi:hypothetical protein